MPERIQLSRAAGSRLPENAVNVARPGRFGNPFTVKAAIEAFGADAESAHRMAVAAHRKWLLHLDPGENDSYQAGRYDRRWVSEHISDLRGKDLACWCKPGESCHADLLLELAAATDG